VRKTTHLAKKIDVDLASVGVLRQIADMSQAKYAVGGSAQQDVLKSIAETSKLPKGQPWQDIFHLPSLLTDVSSKTRS